VKVLGGPGEKTLTLSYRVPSRSPGYWNRTSNWTAR